MGAGAGAAGTSQNHWETIAKSMVDSILPRVAVAMASMHLGITGKHTIRRMLIKHIVSATFAKSCGSW